jgi:sec-independent protein translocase protein TatC
VSVSLRRRIRRVGPDEQLTLTEHLDELRSRIIVILCVFTVALAVCFWQNGWIYDLLTDPINDRRLAAFSPMEPFLNSIAVAVYAAFIITIPVLSWQAYAFVIPAFAEDHHRSMRPLVVTFPLLFLLGVVFCWFIVLPAALDFLTSYNSDQIEYIPRARDYIQFVMLTLLSLGVVFELPIVMLVLGRIGLVTSAMMKRHWRISIVALALIAALLPGADPITMMAEFIPLLLLYGISYFLVRAAERRRKAQMDAWFGDEDTAV